MTTTATKLSAVDLQQYTGTECYHRFSGLFSRHVLTDGAQYVAETCGAYWLMDAIASHHRKAMRSARLREMQIWKLRKCKRGSGCVLTCWEDTGADDKPVITQRIEFTDFFQTFDDSEITLYVLPCETLFVVMLPSEY